MNQELNKTKRFPYPTMDYVCKFFWIIFKYTLWQISWHRFYYLRAGILKLFGAQVYWATMVFGTTNISRPWALKTGKNVTIGRRTHLYNLSELEIGDNTVISQDVYVCGGTHNYTNSKLPLVRKKIVIGSNVWIAAGAFIGPGITIGDGAVIGARAVVLKDVEPWTVVGGNPAKFIKKRVIND